MLLVATVVVWTLAAQATEPAPAAEPAAPATEAAPAAEAPPAEPPPVGAPTPPPLALEAPRDPLPHMKWNEPVICAFLVPTKAVPSGEFRLQCDDVRRVCLVSPTRELDDEGVETQEPLARTQPCSYSSVDWQRRAARGWRFLPAVAEAAPGWFRDERGRVMQFNFDLNRRVYLGGGWSPLRLRTEDGFRNTYRAEFGVEIEFPDDERDTLFRIHLLETEFYLPDNSGSFTTFRYDWSHLQSRPVARLSTFIGKPMRFDLNLNLGGYLEALTFETIRRGGQTESQLMLATAQPTFDLWHSKDLVSYVRIRTGPGLALDTVREAVRLAGQAALEADVTMDPDGFHHLRLLAEGEQLFFTRVPGRSAHPQRLRLRAEYEVVFLAINDQPLSLVLDGRGTWRNDIEGYPAGWEWSAGAGLRFSLWAPARRSAPTLEQL